MNGAGIQDWVFWLTGAALALLGLALGAWALFWDRSRGRKRCPKCWYDMDGIPESQRDGRKLLVCPECGKEIPDPRTLLRTRSRPRAGATAVLLLAAAYLIGKAPAWRGEGWTALVPTSVLVFVAPTGQSAQTPRPPATRALSPPPSTYIRPTTSEELAAAAWNRLFAGEMARWQSELYISRFLTDSRDSVLNCVDVPDRWPIGEPIPVRVKQPWWARWGRGWLAPAGSTEVESNRSLYLAPALAQGPLGLTLEVRIPTRVVCARDVVMPTQFIADPVSLMNPVDSDEVSQRVCAALSLRLVRSFGEPLILAEDRTEDPRWTSLDFRLAYRIEIIAEGRVIGTATGAANGIPLPWRNWCVQFIDWEPGGEALVGRHPEAVQLVVTGDPMVLLRRYEDWAFHGPPPTVWTGRFETVVPVEPDVAERGR